MDERPSPQNTEHGRIRVFAAHSLYGRELEELSKVKGLVEREGIDLIVLEQPINRGLEAGCREEVSQCDVLILTLSLEAFSSWWVNVEVSEAYQNPDIIVEARWLKGNFERETNVSSTQRGPIFGEHRSLEAADRLNRNRREAHEAYWTLRGFDTWNKSWDLWPTTTVEARKFARHIRSRLDTKGRPEKPNHLKWAVWATLETAHGVGWYVDGAADTPLIKEMPTPATPLLTHLGEPPAGCVSPEGSLAVATDGETLWVADLYPPARRVFPWKPAMVAADAGARALAIWPVGRSAAHCVLATEGALVVIELRRGDSTVQEVDRMEAREPVAAARVSGDLWWVGACSGLVAAGNLPRGIDPRSVTSLDSARSAGRTVVGVVNEASPRTLVGFDPDRGERIGEVSTACDRAVVVRGVGVHPPALLGITDNSIDRADLTVLPAT